MKGAVVEGVDVVNVIPSRRQGRCKWMLITCQSYNAMAMRKEEKEKSELSIYVLSMTNKDK